MKEKLSKYRILIFVILFFGAPVFSLGQTRFSKLKGCEFGKYKNQFQSLIKLSTVTDSFPETILTVKVIFHVIYDNDDQNIPTKNIVQELSDLDRDFQQLNKDTDVIFPLYVPRVGNPRIHFLLADTTFDGSPDKGIKRVARTSRRELFRSDPVILPDKYLNVYTGQINSDGFTYTNPWYNPATDAVFLDYQWVGGEYRLLTHETGHWLGLYHIFEGGCSVENDGIDDTPPQVRSTGMGHACGLDPGNQCTSTTIPMYNNYLDYSDCRVMFTIDQAKAMRSNLLTFRSNIYK